MPRVYVEYRGADAPALIHHNRRHSEQWLTDETIGYLAGRFGCFFDAESLDGIWHIGKPVENKETARDVLARTRKFRAPEFIDTPVREKNHHG